MKTDLGVAMFSLRDSVEEHSTGWGIGTFLALVAILVGLWPIVIADERADGSTSRQFLQWYFSTAPLEPEATWNRVTESLHDDWAGRPEPITMDIYSEFFTSQGRVEATDFGRSQDGWTSTRLTFYSREGQLVEERRVEYQLVCPYWTRLPLISCTANNVMLNDSDDPTNNDT